ncbi:MAG: ATP-binding domain-containing protein, partial [Clostridiaceae bacterium]|nr:ATP-binding domain-containing protein [Clostridiaceae bacterium]
IYVSTIHKAKGREFDTVYLLLNMFSFSIQNDEEKRKLYVAMTRAKEALYIHCNTDIFNKYCVDGVIKKEDTKEYNEPFEISLQLTHRDVFLGFFKDKKEIVSRLRSGCELMVSDIFLWTEINGRTVHVVKFSNRFLETLKKLRNNGYESVGAKIAFIVAWKGEKDEEESEIILPMLHLKKS